MSPTATSHPAHDTSEGGRLDQADVTGAPVHHGGRAGHAGHGDHSAQFRERFWWSLLLALPVVGFSPMFSDLLGYMPPSGTGWVSPVLGTAVFLYGGWPFLTGAWSEARSRQPGMMVLIALAITVSF